jgi:hypothetical protein
MVAFNSTRRRTAPRPSGNVVSAASLIDRENVAKRRETDGVAASRRFASTFEVFRDGLGAIINVRIGRWRVVAASAERRIEEVRELGCDRIAVRLSRSSSGDYRRSCEIWQLYDLQGRLLASLQTSPDGGFAMISDYQARQASRLMRNQQGELETVETWTI